MTIFYAFCWASSRALEAWFTFGALAITDRLARWPVEARAAMVGAAVGALAWFAPGLVGGGDALTQQTLGGT
jgi:chloride channel protein, CIC family